MLTLRGCIPVVGLMVVDDGGLQPAEESMDL
jgi:hypothetical protein